MKQVGYKLIPILLAVLAFERPTQAYLDPGSGSMMLQVLLGGAAAVGVILRLYWDRLRERLGFRERDVNTDR